MSTIEERFQIRRELDTWSLREKLCLASAVARIGDQNWMSVSRSLKPFAEPNRPSDWFSQKNCAAQYGSLLESVKTVVENPVATILKRLTEEHKAQIRKKMDEETREYKEQEAIVHAQWLKQRKLEVGRAFRSITKVTEVVTVQKRKASDSLDAFITESSEEAQEASKPTLSPLLTSVWRTPTHVPNITSSILYSAITQRGTATSPTVDSLLNTTASASELVSTAINQEPTSAPVGSSKINAQVIEPEEIVESKEKKIDDAKPEEEIISTVAKDAVEADTFIEKPVDKPLKSKVEPGSVQSVEVTEQDKSGRAKRDYSRMLTDSLQEIDILLAAQEQDENPVRRETRTSELGLKRKSRSDILAKNKKRRNE